MGLSGHRRKKGKKKRGNTVLEAFTMIKSNNAWDNNDDQEDDYHVKGGA